MEHVILVDEDDNEIGTLEKMEAHHSGKLHRAFSVLLFNSKGDILLQKRAKTKYHSGGLWTNTCCSHPLPNEPIQDAIRRKLNQEMGISVQTEFAYKFMYQTPLENNLIEHEYDHVYTGIFDGEPNINPHEVEDWRFISRDQLRNEIKSKPEEFTFWFKLIVENEAFKESIFF
jgi:isopentenyl-diphosphate delta-isomerase